MNWFKAIVSDQESSDIQRKFMAILIRQPRPQTAFMYEASDPIIINKDGIKDVRYTVYFTPNCSSCMGDLIRQYSFSQCSRPNQESVIGLCVVQDYENLVWD